MKKSLLAILMVFVLIFTMVLPVAMADGLGEKLRGLKEKIQSAVGGEGEESENYIVEKLVKKLISYVEEKCEENGIEPSEALDQVMGLITNDEGKIDLSTVVSLIGMFTSGGTDAGAETEDGEIPIGGYLQKLRNREPVLEAYIIEEYQDVLEPGDVQIVSYVTVSNEEDDLRYALGYFSLFNFTADGTDLKLKNSAGAVEYLLFDMDEDLNFSLASVIRPVEGEAYEEGINALCEMHAVSREEFDYSTSGMSRDITEVSDLQHFLEAHPEYERIEYKGEMKTYDEIVQINNDLFDAIMEEAFAMAE